MDNKYVFLDRDGVINNDPGGWTEYGYVTRWEDFHFLPGVLEGMKRLRDAGYRSVIISNQKGIGKGYFTKEALDDITTKMSQVIKEAGGSVDGTYYCIHAKEEDCDCQKPKPGLFIKAQKELGINSFDGKFYVGDTQRDIQAGKAIGLKTILVLTGKSTTEDVGSWEYKPDYICSDFHDVVGLILEGSKDS